MRKSEQDKDPGSENRVAMKTVNLMKVKKSVLAEFHLMSEAKVLSMSSFLQKAVRFPFLTM